MAVSSVWTAAQKTTRWGPQQQTFIGEPRSAASRVRFWCKFSSWFLGGYCPHVASPLRSRKRSLVCLLRTLILSSPSPTLMTSLSPCYLLKGFNTGICFHMGGHSSVHSSGHSGPSLQCPPLTSHCLPMHTHVCPPHTPGLLGLAGGHGAPLTGIMQACTRHHVAVPEGSGLWALLLTSCVTLLLSALQSLLFVISRMGTVVLVSRLIPSAACTPGTRPRDICGD